MPDITMCEGLNCPKRESCYRFVAKPSIRQSFFVETPYSHSNNECDYFSKAENKEILAWKKRENNAR